MLSRTVVTNEVAHILDDPQNRNMNLLEHVERFSHVCQGDFLRSCDEDCSLDGNKLGKAKLRVPGTRRHVDDQVVQVSPLDVIEKLSHSRVKHGTAPDDWPVTAI